MTQKSDFTSIEEIVYIVVHSDVDICVQYLNDCQIFNFNLILSLTSKYGLEFFSKIN